MHAHVHIPGRWARELDRRRREASPVGPRVGLKVGASFGGAFGVGGDPLGGNPMAGVTRDATSGMYCPANATEWTTTLSVAGIASGNPSASYGMQEAAGTLADSIGAFTLTNGAGLLYQQSQAGWTRKGIGGAVNSTTATAQSTDPAVPDINTTSLSMLCYANITAPAATRYWMTEGTTDQEAIGVQSNGKLWAFSNSNTAGGAVSIAGQVRPYLMKYDKTNNLFTCYSDADKVSATLSAPASTKRMKWGSWSVSGCPAFTMLYGAAFFAAAANLTDNNVRSLFQTLGWTVAW